MRRRNVIALLGSAACAWPLLAHAQQPLPLVGMLSNRSPNEPVDPAAALRRGLSEVGYVESRNVTIEYRWAEGHYDRLPDLAADLVRRRVTVIVAYAINSVLAAKSATAAIPIVFTIGGDPVTTGLVASLSRPEGNLTGLTMFSGTLFAKRLELLREIVPAAAKIGVLVNPDNRNAEARVSDVQEAANAIGQQIHIVKARDEADFATAFATLVQQHAGALLVSDDPYFSNRRERLVELSARHGLPAIYSGREFPVSGGLMSYATNYAAVLQQAGVYAGRILKGAKPSDLPVMQPTKFELVINLKTAKAVGITVPQSLLVAADEVIE